jgi:hypothetical protein
MEKIEDYLLKLYNPKNNKRLYHKIYYEKNKKKIINNNLNRYYNNFLCKDFKLKKGEYTIKFS